MGGAHLATGQHGFEDGFDETVVRAAHGALAVGADVDQFAALVPDAYRRAGWQLFGADQARQRLQGLERRRQSAGAARPAHFMEAHRLPDEALEQLLQVLLVAHVAGATRIPEVHETHGPRSLQLERQLQRIAGKQLRPLALEGAQVARLEPLEGGEHGTGPEQDDQRGEQVFAAGAHGGTRVAGGQACHGAAQS